MEDLIERYRLFHDKYFENNRSLFKTLSASQNPEAMVISCCDSRVDPSLILNARPGEIFTLRNIANLVPPYSPDEAPHSTSAAIEYAVTSLKIGHIMVLGHSNCGGVKALLDSCQGEFVGPWMSIASAARVKALAASEEPERVRRLCELENIKISLANLRSYPWVAERMGEGSLILHGLFFEILEGRLWALDEAEGDFVTV